MLNDGDCGFCMRTAALVPRLGVDVDSATVQTVDLKSKQGQEHMQTSLRAADVLLTSFRPSALEKLGLVERERDAEDCGETQRG